MSQATDYSQREIFWKDHIQTFRDSGLSKARYCRNNELTYHQFIYWVAKFSSASSDDTAVSTPRSSKLIPVMLQEPEQSAGLQLHLPNGASISGISAHSVDLVRRLIDQL